MGRRVWVGEAVVLVTLLFVGCGGNAEKTPGGDEAAGASGSEPRDGDDNSDGGERASELPVPASHRMSGQACDESRPESDLEDPTEGDECQSHEECTEGENGRCLRTDDFSSTGAKPYKCTYDECFSDADCGNGGVCRCSGNRGTDATYCLMGNCSVDSECDSGYCSPSLSWACPNFPDTAGYFCHTPEDECVNNLECGSQAKCVFAPKEKRWMCVTGGCLT
jgi:hypothetical protein